jgi:4-hydroxy-3-polyprenylbenzoate decarboxylase
LKNKVIIGITGASGVVLGVRLVELLRGTVETYVIVSDAAKKILEHETDYSFSDIEKEADHVYSEKDMFAPVASGSFKTDGMVVVPCSMKSLSNIAHGFSENLLTRSADVCLKERRKLILVTRETPLSTIHIENMLKVSNAGGIVLPANVSYYSKPKNIKDMENHILGKVLDLLGIDNKLYNRWGND